MKKSILSFDLTGTLATFRFCDSIYFEGLPKLYANKYEVEIEEARQYLEKAYDEVGDQEADWYDLTYWFDRFDLGNGWDSLLNELSHNIQLYPESENVLANLSKKYELILISNACREFLEIETSDIGKYFTRLISCVSDFREVKKTPELYSRVCDFLGLKPDELIHIGDNWQFDYIAPTECGITAYHLDRTRKNTGEFVIHDLSEIETKLL